MCLKGVGQNAQQQLATLYTMAESNRIQVAGLEAEWQERCEVAEQERDMWRQQMEASGELCSALHAELADANRSKEEGVSHLV
jgi:hypothetical protein